MVNPLIRLNHSAIFNSRRSGEFRDDKNTGADFDESVLITITSGINNLGKE